MRILLLFVAFLLQQSQPQPPTIYEMEGSSSYHVAGCPLAATHQLKPVTAADARSRHLSACLVCKPLDNPAIKDLIEWTEEPNAMFVTTASTVIRTSPEAASQEIATVPALTVLTLYGVQPGWARVGSGNKWRGWSPAKEENLLPRNFIGAFGTVARLDRHPDWPQTTKLAILHRQAKIGFTAEQVTLALDEPIRRVSEETAAGTVETWTYLGQVVTFSEGKVTKILSVK
jgi:hypothetical protein